MASAKDKSAEPAPTAEEPVQESTSSDAQWSVYQSVSAPKDAPENPPPGPQVEQVRGAAQESSD